MNASVCVCGCGCGGIDRYTAGERVRTFFEAQANNLEGRFSSTGRNMRRARPDGENHIYRGEIWSNR